MFDLFDNNNFPDTLHLKVTANAKSEKIKKIIRDDGTVYFRVYVCASPEKGKANESVINLISKELGVAKTMIKITHGILNREKVIKIEKVNN